MIHRAGGNLICADREGSPLAGALERDGYAVIERAFAPAEVADLHADMERVLAEYPADRGTSQDGSEFRYDVYNRSAVARRVVGARAILDVIEPLLGEDCHVIANTLWKNPAVGFTGQPWHTDAGPHVPRPAGIPWDDRIPYPVFVVAAHILLEDVTEADGATAVVPGSHRSGQPVPFDRMFDLALDCDGTPPRPLTGRAGDVILFTSDLWHRGLPSQDGANGRFFLQCHYGRRDIAPRLWRPQDVAQLDPALVPELDERSRRLFGLHPAFFYDG